MKLFLFFIVCASIFCGTEYLFVGIIRSEIFLFVNLILMVISILGFCAISASAIYDKISKPLQLLRYSLLAHLLTSVIMCFTNVGVTENKKLYTIQMTYSDGYTEMATYKLPDNSELYIRTGSRRSFGSDLMYKYYPNKFGLIQSNIIRYKVISIKDTK